MAIQLVASKSTAVICRGDRAEISFLKRYNGSAAISQKFFRTMSDAFSPEVNIVVLPLSLQFRCGLEFVKQKVHFFDPLVDVPMSAIPGIVGETVIDGVQPSLCGVVHAALINTR